MCIRDSSYYAGAARPELILQGQFPGEFVLSTRSFNQNAGFSAEDLEAVRRLGGVSEVFSTRESGANLLLPADKVTAEFSDLMENTFGQTFPQSGTYSSSTGLYGYSENILELARSYLETGVDVYKRQTFKYHSATAKPLLPLYRRCRRPGGVTAGGPACLLYTSVF